MDEHQRRIGDTTLRAVRGDLTKQTVDAIVNAANVQLRHGGGVAQAIARAGGPTIQEESNAWVAEHGPLTDGVAAVTGAGEMPATHVVHTAGPLFDDARDDNESRLRAATRAALDAASEVGARTIAFPAISAGIYGYPPDDATAVVVSEVATVVSERPQAFDEVRFVGFDQAMVDRFAAGLEALDRASDGS